MRAVTLSSLAILIFLSFLVFGERSQRILPPFEDLQAITFAPKPLEGKASPFGFSLRSQCDENVVCPELEGYPDLPVRASWWGKAQAELRHLYAIPRKPLHGKAETFGLSGAGDQIVFQTKDGEEFDIRIGVKNPYLAGYYAQFGGNDEEFFLLPASLHEVLTTAPLQILDEHLFSSANFSLDIRSFVVTKADGRNFRFVRGSEGWLLNGNEADAPFVRGMLSEIERLQFDTIYRAGEAVPVQLSTPFLEVLIQRGAETGPVKTEALSIYRLSRGEESSEYFAKKGSLSYVFRLRALPRMMRELREEHFLR